ncbi:DNA polymerase IV [Fulvivirga sedimenti]|uniref:DNA polymerase IV n=1 Tax=Fulvivirga sedimenti TaxID=2879465 RepID=A0A9X1HRB0_9BACT|nr:DNA polymerase IV [Fulvivirga sedimenti]MCA6075548.1 DNA polymerase IV [Fulvivirga sedimenti]MCA6076725.1 DNA polymerase IV [Fulvivirga sedimenti]MCA6077853.1 DNA polymerase IV [Fulvivirga sedimenti]
MQGRAILHLDLDTFFVSCERLLDSRLEGKPILLGGVTDRGVVAACSYEARKFGVHSAMPMKLARQLCPEAVIIRGNTGTYTAKSREVTEIIRESVPVYEKTSIDEFYVDLTGMERFFNSFRMAADLRKRIIRETGLPISFGLSENKTVSKIATGEAKPNNQLKIDYGQERPFLAPLSVRKIPMIGEKTYQSLCGLGIKRIATIQEMPMELMEKVFGQNGISIWKKAQGIDTSPVIPYSERKSISTERTFDRDTTDMEKLRGIILAMAENLAFQLRRGKKVTACITVKIRYSDFNTYTLQSRIPYTSADHILIPRVMELFNRVYNRRLLVRLIGIKYSHLVYGGHQISLFEDAEEMISLYQAMDRIREKHGDRKILRASGMEARTIGRFNPFSGEPPPLLANRHN